MTDPTPALAGVFNCANMTFPYHTWDLSHMPTLSVPPNFVSVRLTDDDKRAYKAVQDHMFKLVGTELPMADVYRLGVKALVEKHNLKIK